MDLRTPPPLPRESFRVVRFKNSSSATARILSRGSINPKPRYRANPFAWFYKSKTITLSSNPFSPL